MKRNCQLLFIGFVLVFMASSCQKQYERPDVVIGTNPGTGGGGSTGGVTGPLLIKAEGKTTGNTPEAFAKTYDYDVANRIIKITDQFTDSSNQTKSIVYRYERDASGKVTRVISNFYSAMQPGGVFPDSVYVKVHYPSGSVNFDYTVYSFDFVGMTYTDSITFTYTNGVVTGQTEYTGFSGMGPMSAGSNTKYQYANGNLINIKYYAPASPTVPVTTYSIEFDTKTSPLTTGVESFLFGQSPGLTSTNNAVKETVVENGTGTTGALVTYSYQYNANNQPVTGAQVQTIPINKTQNVKFTYK
jgi:hypothetical protein